MQNAKVKEVHQYGQLLVEGTTKEKAYVSLRESEAMWNNPKLLNRRISPASLQTVSEKEQLLTFTTNTNYRSMAILDYIIRRETFLTDKIPLLFVYTMEVSSSNIEFTFKYKTNDKWKHRLFDVDIIVALDK